MRPHARSGSGQRATVAADGRAASQRGRPRPVAPALTPIVLAMLAAFPLLGQAQVRPVRPAPPAAATVPQPLPGWRVSGTGAAAPLNRPNANGGTDQTIGQTSPRAIYQWKNFDIGAASSVNFGFATKDSSALNRVLGSTAPSQIFGRLGSTIPGADGKPVTGGTVLLINQNGILFGPRSQVNTGALIASTLNVVDADYLAGFELSLRSTEPTFVYEGGPELYSDGRTSNFVRVDPGATIETPNGGRVFLFANQVQNAGTIRTPGGQTVLAAGLEVYLNDPTAERLYASEVNPDFPALRGLLVEVGKGSGSAANLAGGTIDTPRGNTTLVAMAVNQSGRVSATTSVAENGSVMLLARGHAQGGTERGTIVKRASTSGALTLGDASRIEIAPDADRGSDGKPVTSDGNSTFTRSRVELSGKTIEFKPGAAVVAHGGVVDVRAESQPFYQANTNFSDAHDWALFDPASAARLTIGQGARIDVSGTTSSVVSTARNFVTTELIGRADLKDAPLQKDGPLYRSKVSFDVRGEVPILGDTDAYLNAIQRTVEERLSSGGTLSLSAHGAVVTHPEATLSVAGGQVAYTEAMVRPTRLVAADGTRYTLDKAPPDIVYTAIEGASGPVRIDRWGIVPNFVPSQSLTGRIEPGYVEGQAGGVLSVIAPTSLLDGHVQAATIAGIRQTGGQDAMAAPGRIELGVRANGIVPFGDASFLTAGLQDLAIVKDRAPLPTSFWRAPSTEPIALANRIAAATLNESGVGQLTITADGGVVQEVDAGLVLAPKSEVNIAAAGAKGIALGAGYRSAGGSFTALTADLSALANSGPTTSGPVVLQAGQAIDVAGAWVNRLQDGADVAAATPGGVVALHAAHGLNLHDASRIDVSGGATVAVDGTVQGTAGGSTSLQSNLALPAGEQPAAIHIGAVLKGQSLAGGGTLRLRADTLSIGSRPLPGGIGDGSTLGSLTLSPAFFNNGAFGAYDLAAVHSLDILPGTVVAPEAVNWLPSGSARNVPSGTRPETVFAAGSLPDAERKPVHLSLSAVAPFAAPTGKLTVGSGAKIVADPLAAVSLTAGRHLVVDGTIEAPGGKVSLALAGGRDIEPVVGSLRLGDRAAIDVSGSVLLQPRTGAMQQGQVLPGGTVSIGVQSLSTRTTPVELRSGATIAADGASAQLGVAITSAGGGVQLREQAVGSAGGSISIQAQEGGAVLAGTVHAKAGDAHAPGGQFSLTLRGLRDTESSPPVNLIDNYTIVVQQAPVVQSVAVPGSVLLSANSLREGFGDVTLRSLDRIRFSGDVDLAMARSLRLDAPVVSASPDATSVALSAGSTLHIGSTPDTGAGTFAAVAGGTALSLKGGLVEFFGHQALQGFRSVTATAGSEVRLNGLADGNKALTGSLALQADLTLDAPQVVPTSNSRFRIDAPGQRVLITGGDEKAAVPLSAGAEVTIAAREITTVDPANPTRYGVLRAPQGSLSLNASDSIQIGPSSLLSVASAASEVPFGSTLGGRDWTYLGNPLVAPTAKTIDLSAPGQRVDVSRGARLDLSGGSDLLALEFIAGPGGSSDIFAGAAGGAFAVVPAIRAFAPVDADILALQDSTGRVAAFTPGRQIEFGTGGPLPAGRYAVLPARYAVLSGAYLVRPVASSAPLALGVAIARPDGSTLVGGRYADAGTARADALPSSFQVMDSILARGFSEIRQASASDHFSARAEAADTAVVPLPIDAGRLNIAADRLTLKGSTAFALPADRRARGGEIDISASNILIGATQRSVPGTLSLAAPDLNATGASLIVIGGTRAGAELGALDVVASRVTVDNAGAPLKVDDLVLVANDRVEIQRGAVIEASGSAASPALALVGDGALLRVSSDRAAASTRTEAARVLGDLVVGPAATLQGGAITAEATHRNTIADSTRLSASSVTLGAGRIAVGQAGAAGADANTLVLSPSLAAQVNTAQELTLRSFDGLDFHGSAALGSPTLQSLVLDTGTLRLVGPAARATIEAGRVQLANSSGAEALALPGTGALTISAASTSQGLGQIVLGPGSMAVSGAAKVDLNATREVVVSGSTALASSGDLTVHAAALQADPGASALLTAAGRFAVRSAGKPAPAEGGLGAHLVVNAAGIEQAGRIALPSGELVLNATGGAATGSVRFRPGSVTDLSGRGLAFDGIDVATAGGDLRVASANGNVLADAGSVLDVSAPQGAGAAGSLALFAPQGGVVLNGALRATGGAGQPGGTLSVDSRTPVDLGLLALTLNAVPDNFSESVSVRNRSGNQTVPGGGPGLAAQHIAIASDAGTLTVAGRLDAHGARGPSLMLAGGVALTLQDGAELSARGSAAAGGQVTLASGTLQRLADGSPVSNGVVRLDGGSIDTRAATSDGADGQLLVRAQRDALGSDLRVATSPGQVGTSVVGAARVEVEAVKQYVASEVDASLIERIDADIATFAGPAGASAAKVRARIGGLIGQPVQLRAGAEVVSDADLRVSGLAENNGWNLTRFDANGRPLAQPTGAPVNLTLRAAGNLDLAASVSDGFIPAGERPTTAAEASRIVPAAVVAPTEGGRIRLVGGADLQAADAMRTRAGTASGDVTIGAEGTDVLVRTSTGSIEIASGRDTVLLNRQAAVYTTGRPVEAAALDGFVGNNLSPLSYLSLGSDRQALFLTGGGGVEVRAGRDIVGATGSPPQYGSDWLWRQTDAFVDGQPMWWGRYDQFQQGFATFGGGGVTARAGRDALNVEVSAATGAYVARDAAGKPAQVREFGGGDVVLEAQRDIVGGFMLSGRGVQAVRAGRDIAAAAEVPALQLVYGNTQASVRARNHVDLGVASSFGLIPATGQLDPDPLDVFIGGLAPNARLDVQADAGDLNYRAVSTASGSFETAQPRFFSGTVQDLVIPDRALFAAPGGSVQLAAVLQVPARDASLALLAQRDVTTASIAVSGTQAAQARPAGFDFASLTPFAPGAQPYDTGDRGPLRVVARDGDATLGGVAAVKPIRVVAGRDLTLAGGEAGISMELQHQAAAELSSLVAGRDIVFPNSNIASPDLKLHGGGDLLLVAGRHIGLGTSGGAGTVGNRENAALADGSARITMLAGVSLGPAAYAQAQAWYFPLLGGTGIAGHAPDLFAQLQAANAGAPLPTLGSAAASEYQALPADRQVSQAKSVTGTDVFDAALLADARRREADPSLTLAAATKLFDAYADADKVTVAAAALAGGWAARLPRAAQTEQALAMAAAQGQDPAYTTALTSFVQTQTSQPGLSPAEAVQAFLQLAPERQLLFTNEVLVNEVRAAGRAASALAGAERDAAYAKAYATLDVVFPGAGGSGSIDMGASQVRTSQGGDIVLFAPRGGINVGDLASGRNAKRPADLGIVTAAGGDIALIVRDDVAVNQSRVFTVGRGDLLMWSSAGNLDAGRGAKTVAGAPPPVFRFDEQGNFVIDTSGSFTGSGIAVLDAGSTLDLYAPKGEINAGDAGIKSLGNAFLGAARFVGADNLTVAGVAVGAPPPPPSGGDTAGVATAGQAATTSSTRIDTTDSDEEKQRKRRQRLNLVLDFLGFGDAASKP